jgi:hypothetical protein
MHAASVERNEKSLDRYLWALGSIQNPGRNAEAHKSNDSKYSDDITTTFRGVFLHVVTTSFYMLRELFIPMQLLVFSKLNSL